MIRIIDTGTIAYEERWIERNHPFVWQKRVHANAMSSIRKSASFRSRIPVRRTKPLPRRCYSPPPLSNVSSSTDYHSSNPNKSRGTAQATTATNKHKQRHPIWLPQPLNTSASGPAMASNKTATATYSSSSYSSSDESQESEAPLQVSTRYTFYRNNIHVDLYRCAVDRVQCLWCFQSLCWARMPTTDR